MTSSRPATLPAISASRTGSSVVRAGMAISIAFFVYLRDPDGHRIELFTSDYLAVDPDFEPIRWHLHDPRRQTLWGGVAPKSWFLEGSLVEAFDGGWVKVEESQLQGLPAYVR